MPGTVVLQGGGPFSVHDDLDRRLLSEAKADRVVVLPTADAFERPEVLVSAAMSWAERLGVHVEALMVMSRPEAMDEGAADVVRSARAVWLVGDNPIHLRSVVKDTPIWDALHDVLQAGGVVVGCAASASALCDPMLDPRGGALALGLGLLSGMTVVPQSETLTPDRQSRVRRLTDVPLVFLPSTSSLLRTDAGWEAVGPLEVVGELPS
ncbi:MAG: Type 1 glutamine amidotransferase-like domain-containing protein [Actinomycetota bacterium]|nr:Type 1 glutamine amidotransferase-like domain-containing protein [Actinomycetota bacterium]MDA2971765.1 Type 1 glutamine amidotransferase-like domain-containing protein [Actinomycetota bacterium]MDA3000580.1 Type 1 glutamine amidotransferase-like domain-containing protein [Actinomycetota bacterium]